MGHSDWYLDRDESEVRPLSERLYAALNWFFSDDNIRENGGFLGSNGNKVAFPNAYVDHAEGKYMVYDPPTNYKCGCSFWGCIWKINWQAMTSGARKLWCENKAKEILHINN